MKSNMLLKLCAVGSSLLLAAGFVSYRAGALDWMRKPDPPAIVTPVAPEYVSPVETSTTTIEIPASATSSQMFGSSKSGAVFIDPEKTSTAVPNTQELPEETILFSGSKTLMPAPPPTEK